MQCETAEVNETPLVQIKENKMSISWENDDRCDHLVEETYKKIWSIFDGFKKIK